MSNKPKKFLVYVISVAIILLLAACSDHENESSKQMDITEETETVKETDTVKKDEASEEPYDPYGKYDELIEITLADSVDTSEQPNGDTYDNNAYWDYIKDVLNVEMEYEVESADNGDYTTALSLAITAEEIPDIVVCYDYAMALEMIENDLVCDMTEIIENYASESVKEHFNAFDYDVFKKVTFDGRIMAIPRITFESGAVVWLRQDWLDRLNITVDTDGDNLVTREELEMIATEFVTKDPGNSGDPVGFAVVNSSDSGANYNTNMISQSFGAPAFWWTETEDGSIVNGSTVPAMKESLKWWADMYDKNLLDVQYGVTTDADIKAMMANGRLGICFGQYSLPNWFLTDVYALDKDADFVAYGIDDGTGKQQFSYSDSQNRFVLVSKECEHPEVAMKLYNIFWDLYYTGALDTEEIATAYPEFYRTYVASSHAGNIQNVNPVNLAPGAATAMEDRMDAVKQWKEGTLSAEDITDGNARLYIEAITAIEEGTATPTNRAYYDMYGSNETWVSLVNSGKTDMSKELSVIATDVTALYEADLKTLTQEAMIKIITGEEPIEYFDTFVEEFYNRGGDKISEEYKEFYK